MKILFTINSLLILYINVHSYVSSNHINEKVTFQRTNVESNPFMNTHMKSEYTEYDANTFFQRMAVESVPKSLVSLRLPLRDAVEYRPLEELDDITDDENEFDDLFAKYENNVEHEFEDTMINDEVEFVLNPNIQRRPPVKEKYHLFRADSPYQQILDIDSIQFSQLKQNQKAKPKTTDYKILCYMTNWAFYRKSDGKFVPENLVSNLCTHVIYSFASLDPETLQMKEFDPWADIDNNLYNRVTALQVPVLLALGGWTDSVGDKYSRLVSSGTNRYNFIERAIGFLNQYGFSGLHLDWNYPVCWQSNCNRGSKSDKPNFTKFVKELKTAFDQYDPPLILGVAVSGYKEVIQVGYDIPALSNAADFLTVMSYDYHGAWESQTGHVSPLFGRPNDKYPQYNTDYTMKLLVEMGAKKEKLIMGIPFYGQSFTLTRSRESLPGEGALTSGPGRAGEFTKQPGMLAYYEICIRVKKQKWKVGRESDKSGPYASLNDQWVGFDDVVSVQKKASYVVKSNYGGIAAWTVDLDDFLNKCCTENFPLLRAINREFGRLTTSISNDCTKPPSPVTPVAPIMAVTEENGMIVATTPAHTHTTWPSWTEATTKPTTKWTTTTSRTTTTTRRTTTSTRRPTTTTTTTRKPTVTTRRTTTTTRRPSTTTRPTEGTTIPVPAIIRPDPSDGESCTGAEYRPDPMNCNAYYRCALGELTKYYCAGGLHWNHQNLGCDWPDNAKCTYGEDITSAPETTTRQYTTRSTTPYSRYTTKPATRTTTSTRRTTTTARRPIPSTKPPTYPSQEGQHCESGDYSKHEECDYFNICVNNQKLPFQCGPGQQWNDEKKNCDWAQNVNCISRREYTNFLRLTKSSETNPCTNNELTPHSTDCNVYLMCDNGKPLNRNCAPGLHFNAKENVCDWPKHANCRQRDEVPSDSDDSYNEIDESSYTTRKTTTTPTMKPVTTTTEKPNLEPFSGHYKLVCYFTNWAWYRKGVGKYVPENIDTDLCTHVVYGFAVLDYTELTIKTHDSWADIDNKFYERVVAMKDKGVKVTVAIGGWNDSAGDKYSRLVRSANSRAKFVAHVSKFIEKYGFDGLDLDWEYPVCWQVDCKKGNKDEKEGFTELVKLLSEEFKPRGWLLSSAVSPSKTVIDAGYDVPKLAEYFDWIAVMTYDFHGQWDKQTGHVAPLYYHPDDEIDFFNANSSIHYWMEKGAPAQKLVMGMPLYGQSFTLADKKNNGLNAKAPRGGEAGEYTRASGFLAYYEICDRIKNKNWQVVYDEQSRLGPYAYKDTQWVSFDDKAMLRKKSQFIRSLGLAGGMVWALDLDDFKNRCGEGHHPLLRTIRDVLSKPPNSEDKYSPSVIPLTTKSPERTTTEKMVTKPPDHNNEDKETEDNNDKEETEDQEDPEENEETGETESKPSNNDILADPQPNEILENDEFKVICYFTNWAWYRQGGGKFVPEDIDADLCTHIVYGFAVLNRETLTIKPHDSWADIDNKFYERVVTLKAKGVKVSVAIGGWNDSAGDKYSRLVLSASSRMRFVKDIIAFIEKYDFDGLDLDWEYPVCWQVDCKKGDPDEKQGFVELVKLLSEELKPRNLLLSTAVSPSKKVIDAGYDIPQLNKYFDWIAVMTYDFHGQWDKKTGHIAPMYEHPDDFDKTFNCNFSINYWLSEGADRKKIMMGMPMYGQSFSLAETSNQGLNAPTYGGGEAGDDTRARGFLSYYEICNRIREKNWEVVRDGRGRMGPYAFLRDQWVSFDDAPMIRHKSEFVKAMGLGGAMIWALDLDDFRNTCDCEEYPLLRTINRVLRNYPAPHPKCKLETLARAPPVEKPSVISTSEKPTTKKPRTTTKYPITSKTTTRAYVTSRRPTKTTPPNTKPSTTTTEAVEIFDPFCSIRLFVAHKSDCNKYYVCQHGQLFEQRCPEGLHWYEDHCDWPGNANCELQGSNDLDDETTSTTTKKPVRTTTKPSRAPTTTRKATNTTSKRPYQDEVTTKTTRKPTRKPTSKPITKPSKKPQLDEQPVIVNPNSEYKVVCYFTNWAWYRPGQGKYTPNDIDDSLCTHIMYGFAVLNRDTLTIKTHDSWADIDNKFYERVAEYKSKGIKVSLALGGWNDSLGDKYSRLVRSASARARFVEEAIKFIEKYGFEGLDLDWEYPVCWQVDCDKGYPDEKDGFTELVRELSDEFKPRGWLLSAAVSPSKKVIDAGYDVPEISKYFDWIAVMTYDFHGHWDKQTGHVAPLYYYPGDTYDYFNANFSINYWIEKGAPPSKLVMGMPLYGQAFTLEKASDNDVNSKITGPGTAGKYTRAAGFLAYYEICDKVINGDWTVVRDEEGRIGPYAYKDRQWVSYDDVAEIRRKSKFLKSMNLAGGMVWALDLDDFRGKCGCGPHPLLTTLNQELGRITTSRKSDCT